MTGVGPTALGYCDVPGADDPGLEVEYWDPNRTTTAFNYHLTDPDNETVYSGTKMFSDPIGYWRGCIAPDTLNGTNPDVINGTYNGTNADGPFNGSLEWPEPSFGGPIGGGGGGGASQATTFGGWLLLAAGVYFVYRRYGAGQVGTVLSSVNQQVSSLLGR